MFHILVQGGGLSALYVYCPALAIVKCEHPLCDLTCGQSLTL